MLILKNKVGFADSISEVYFVDIPEISKRYFRNNKKTADILSAATQSHILHYQPFNNSKNSYDSKCSPACKQSLLFIFPVPDNYRIHKH